MNTNKSLLPLIIAVIIGVGVGYGIAQLKSGPALSEARSQVEDAQAAEHRAQEAIANVETRANRSDGYRELVLAGVALAAGDSAAADKHLSKAVDDLTANSDPTNTDLGKKVKAVQAITPPPKQRAALKSLIAEFEKMIPVPLKTGRSG